MKICIFMWHELFVLDWSQRFKMSNGDYIYTDIANPWGVQNTLMNMPLNNQPRMRCYNCNRFFYGLLWKLSYGIYLLWNLSHKNCYNNCYGNFVIEFAPEMLRNLNCNKIDVVAMVVEKLLRNYNSAAKHFATKYISIEFHCEFHNYIGLATEFQLFATDFFGRQIIILL